MLSYLKRLKDRWTILFIFSLLMFIPALFYSLASFYHTIHPNRSLLLAILIAVIFASIEYIFKVPLVAYGYREGLTRKEIQIIWIVITLITVSIIDYIHPNPKAL